MTRPPIADARLMLIFTPSVCVAHDPLEAAEAALDSVDVIQVRIKDSPDSVASARETYEWTKRILELRGSSERVLVLVNDRVEVAAALRADGCAGVHLGQDDCPPQLARRLLGPAALIGLSTHDVRQVAQAEDLPVDYLGFGPFAPTRTKGYEQGLGASRAWVAQNAAGVPVFCIGGIDATNAHELAQVGRAAVSSAILNADDPAQAARNIRHELCEPEE